MTCCDNCGNDDVHSVCPITGLCRVCRGETEEIRDERSDEDVYEGVE